MRSLFITTMLTLCLAGLLAAPGLAARPSPIQKAMQGLRWGQPMTDVVKVLLSRIEQDLEAKLAETPGWEPKSKLRKAAQERMRSLRNSYTRFTGAPTPHDHLLRRHVAHHNDESVVVDSHGSVADYYIFHKDRLWKWVRVLQSPSLRSQGFDIFAKEVQKRFGRGQPKRGASEVHEKHRWLEWQKSGVRLRALDHDATGAFSLVFDDPRKAQQLIKERTATRAPEPEKDLAKGRQKNLRSVMSQTQQEQETEEQWRERVRREQNRQAEAQRATHERNQQIEQGKALKALDGIDDSDPLGGLGQ